MNIDVFSDAICPWCWIGKRRLAAALAEPGCEGITVTWRAFQLYPELPPEGMPRALFMQRRWGIAPGSPEADPATNPAWQRIAAEGAREGLAFNFGRAARVPNTLLAHRLVRWAHVEDGASGQDRMVEALFEAYFSQGADIGDAEVLTETAAAAGFPAATVRAWLATDEGSSEVLHEVQWSRDNGITGVPCFVLPNGHGVPGAQDSAALARFLRKGKELLASTA